MKTTLRTLTAALLFPALLGFGCAHKGSANQSAMSAGPTSVPMLAKKAGVTEGLVQMALQAAQNYLSSRNGASVPGAPPASAPTPPTAEDKSAAAQVGVQAAAQDLQNAGKSLSEKQAIELREGIQSML